MDKRAYRSIMESDKLSVYHATKIEKQIEIYIEYTKKLHSIANEFKIEFSELDRILYIFDKKENGNL